MNSLDKLKKFAKTGVLFAMFLLMVGTMVMFVRNEGRAENTSSYSLTVEKRVENANPAYPSDSNVQFSFTVQFSSDEGTTDWGKYNGGTEIPESGIVSIILKDNQSATFELNGEYRYTITETSIPTDYSPSEASKSGMVYEGSNSETITNIYDPRGSYNIRHEYYIIPWDSPYEVDTVTYNQLKADSSWLADTRPETGGSNLALDDSKHYEISTVTVRENGFKHQDRLDYCENSGSQKSEDYVIATKDGDETIVLVYVKKETPPDQGQYYIVHEYYVVDANGHRSAEPEAVTVPFLSRGDLNHEYYASPSLWQEKCVANGLTYTHFGDAYGAVDGSKWQEDTNKSSATALKDGTDVIILRYERKPGGYYRVVHEYYHDEVDPANLVGRTDMTASETTALPNENTYTANSGMWEPVYEGVTYTHVSDAYGTVGSGEPGYEADSAMQSVKDTENGEQVIILQYVYQPQGAYQVIHEYYFKDGDDLIPEGTEGPSTVGNLPLDSTTYTVSGVEWITEHTYNGETHTYTHDNDAYGTVSGGGYAADAAMTSVIATEDNSQIIILRYVRTASDGPEEPGEPETPDEPEYPTELPDPNDPDSPEEITILEEDVPKTYVKVWDPEEEEWIYIPEDEVPLAPSVPQTGDGYYNVLWGVLAAASLGGLAALTVVKRRKEQ